MIFARRTDGAFLTLGMIRRMQCLASAHGQSRTCASFTLFLGPRDGVRVSFCPIELGNMHHMSADVSLADFMRDLPVDLRAPFERALAARKRTVWDARRILAVYRGKVIRLAIDDGQFADTIVEAVFEDVIRDEEGCFALVLRGLLPSLYSRRDHPLRRVRHIVPLPVIRAAPSQFHFLWLPPEQWPMPDLFMPCSHCGYKANTGRFCVRCGKIVRRSKDVFLGEGFSVLQSLLRELCHTQPDRARPCRCGAMIAREDKYCAKCGLS